NYQVRIAVRDNKSGRLGTLSRYLDVPALQNGRLSASTLLLWSAPAGDTKAANPIAVTANYQVSRSQDLRYAVNIYNAKLREGKPQVKTQLVISQNGREIFREPEEQVSPVGSQLIKMGQLGLGSVKPGRYTLTLVITDTLADKKLQLLTR